MPKKSPRVDAFVDESIRGQTYYLCAVLVSFERQSALRQQLRRISNESGRRRIHFHNESSKRKEQVLSEICNYVTAGLIVQTRVSHGMNEEIARQRSLAELVGKLQNNGVRRLTIETRSNNHLDELTILQERRNGPTLDFVHLDANLDELLWAADAVAWTVGAGSSWLKRLDGMPLQFLFGSP